MGIAPLVDDLAAQLHRRGHDVCVITSFPYHPDWRIPREYHGKLLAREYRNGVTVYRSYVFARPKATVLAKVLFYASFTVSSVVNLIRSGRCDVIVVMAPPPTLVFSALVSRVLHRARLVLDVQDIVPDAAVIFGMMRNPFLIAIFRWVERLCYRSSDSVIGCRTISS
jgi:colanic acid biosynthesis glycosyl transferase WcaI